MHADMQAGAGENVSDHQYERPSREDMLQASRHRVRPGALRHSLQLCGSMSSDMCTNDLSH